MARVAKCQEWPKEPEKLKWQNNHIGKTAKVDKIARKAKISKLP